MEQIKKQIADLGLAGKTVKDLIVVNYSLYYRIYSYSKRNKIWLSKLFIDLGLVLNRIDRVNSIERLNILMNEIYKYRGINWHNIEVSHRTFLKKTIQQLNISFEVFLGMYNIEYEEYDTRVYKTLDQIKEDLEKKNLINANISQITSFDSGKTMANIQSFAEKNGLKMKDVWSYLGIEYQKNFFIEEESGMIRRDYVYKSIDEIRRDLRKERLIGKEKSFLVLYKNGKIYSRIIKFAKRENISLEEIWKKFNIKPSKIRIIKTEFTTIEELREIVNHRNLKSRKELVTKYPDLFRQIKNWTRREKINMKDIWRMIGLTKYGFYSFDAMLEEIKKRGYTSQKQLRTDKKFYRKIQGYTSYNKIDIKLLWKNLGWENNNIGRPKSIL